jgi:hypothetical protein
MGLAGPHLAAYAQSVNLRFTMRGLNRRTRPQTYYARGERDNTTTMSDFP